MLAMLMACNQPEDALVETRHGTSQIEQVPEPAVPEDHRRVEGPSLALSAIDSLMWRQPDSALALLLPYFDTCCRDALNASLNVPHGNSMETHAMRLYNGHYANILLAELLYKNDYAQTNRQDLQKAVAYFDSLTFALNDIPTPKSLIAGADPLSLTRNDRITFLTARAHYINGAGYYEKDSVVEACAEYLKALEIMEKHFEKEELVGTQAQFMTYIYNRIGSLFFSQFMLEPSIMCYKDALDFCIISPTSAYGISNTCCRLGSLYSMTGEKDTALYYYERALQYLPDTNNLAYRNILSSKALLVFQKNKNADAAIKELKSMVKQATDNGERYTRYLTMGDINFEDGRFDSAQYYLEIVFEKSEDIISKIRAAEYLRSIYDHSGQKENADTCVRFLANYKKSDAENKAFVSELNKLFQNYLDKKKEIQVEIERKKAIKKAIGIIIPIIVVVALVIVVMARRRSKKLLKDQQEEAERRLGETEQQHRIQQAALAGRLKKSNEELRDVSMQLEQTLAKTPSESMPHDDYAAYVNTAICQYIVGVVHKQQFKSKMDYLVYKDSALSKEQLLSLRDAAEKHLPRFVSQIRKQYSRLTESDMDYCCLFLLGLSEADVSALMQRAYTTVCDRSRKISRILGADDSLYHTLRNCLSEQ